MNAQTSSAAFPIQGRCTCGAIRFQMKTRPLYTHCCHCSWCQRETGSAFVVNAMIEADGINTLKGQPEMAVIPSNSGKGQKVWRCRSCKVTLWSNYAGAGGKVHFVRVGTLFHPNTLPPDIHIFTKAKQDWVKIPEGHLAVPEYYDRNICWPEESLHRYQQLSKSND